jgi:bacillithiol biosynthesis cysteine-adding enzyme BshC
LTLFQALCDSTRTVTTPSSAPSLVRLAIDVARLPGTRKLGLDYVRHFDRVAQFYAGNPAKAEAWRETIARVAARPRNRGGLVTALAAQQERRQAPAPARASAARLTDPRSVAIVTGQQAGLFGGPVYTLLKAITAIKLARRVEQQHGVPVVPIFWIDAEDHDWDEVAGCTVLDADYAPRGVRLPAPAGAGEGPVARVNLDEGVATALAELETLLPPTEFTAPLLASLRAAYRVGVGMSHAFGAWIETLLGPLGLVVYDSADPATKREVAALFAGELAAAGRTAALAAEAGAQMEALGYHAQVTPAPDTVALFHLGDSRQAIKRHSDGQGFLIGDTPVAASALVDEATRAPEHFSPNVLLRPLVQDTLFPTIAYVGGPSELVYLGQLKGVYEHFGVPMPLVHPRASATLLDSAGARFLTRYDVPLEALQPRDESALNRLLEQQLPREVEQALEAAQQAVNDRMAAVLAVVSSVDATLEGASKAALGKMTHELTTLHNKVIQAAKRRDETLRRQFIRARAQAYPDGSPQERAVGFISLLNRVGPALIELLDRELPLDLGQHWVLAV